jgi:hypothetical protein
MTIQTHNRVTIELIQPFENALRLANPGINIMQARTIIYWALATYYDNFDPKPILLIYKAFGCGKTDLLTTLFPMVNQGRWIEGNTYATIRDELHGCKAAFFDEKDNGESHIPELLLRKRFRVTNSQLNVNRNVGYGVFNRAGLNINGWTAVASRSLFHDVALMSRCLVISPEQVSGEELNNARITNAGSLQAITDRIGTIEQLPTTGRASQVWMPLVTLAFKFNDMEWLGYASTNLDSDTEEQGLSRQYEPEEAVENAYQICIGTSTRLHEHWIKISDVRRTVNTEFEKNFKPEQVVAMLRRKGHEVSKSDGYPVVKDS